MKPKRITQEEYTKIHRALLLKAIKLGKGTTHRSASFYAETTIPQKFLDFHQRFAWECSSNIQVLRHFSPIECNQITLKTEVICLCQIREKGENHFYLHTHKAGKCPWKSVSKK